MNKSLRMFDPHTVLTRKRRGKWHLQHPWAMCLEAMYHGVGMQQWSITILPDATLDEGQLVWLTESGREVEGPDVICRLCLRSLLSRLRRLGRNT
jgi:hypothetical protein